MSKRPTRSKIARLRLTRAEKKAWSKQAARNGVTLSEWIRLKCSGHVGDAFGDLFRKEIDSFHEHVSAIEREMDEHGYGGKR